MIGVALLVGLAARGGPSTSAQTVIRKAATLIALNTYPVFFHGQPVVVRAEAWFDEEGTWLYDGDDRVLWLGDVTSRVEDRSRVESSGTFWDVGRLEEEDPRLRAYDLAHVSEALLDKAWPSPGDLLVLVADRAGPAPQPVAPTLRTIALHPTRYAGQEVSVSGRFRGRNLYGDLPQAPALSLTDFVLHAADGALWVTGLEPRGRDFALNIDARVDTGQWLEVTGTVRHGRGLVWLEGSRVALATQAAGERPEPVVVERAQGPSPEVIFSAPVQDDIDVPPNTTVRLQFSRDMNGDSFRDRIQVAYLGNPVEVPSFTYRYRGGNRVLEIRFDEPLPSFATIRLELLAGLEAFDGAASEPWQLTFTIGGS